MKERYTVFGSNSFSGSHFIELLLRQGHEVLGISRSSEIDRLFRPYSWQSSEGSFEFVRADLKERAQYEAALRNFDPNYVVNFAAQSMVAQSWETPTHWYRTNILGLVDLADTLETLPSLKRYVHVTTPEVYGSTAGWVKESRDFKPSTPYAISRAAGDMHLLALFETKGFPVVLTRAANVYGPGQQLYRLVPRSLLYARLGKRMQLDGGGRSTRSFIHISDVAQATLLIAQQGEPGSTYHISTDEIISISDLVKRACKVAAVPFEELVYEGPDRPGKDATYMLDSSLLRQELGWTPRISLEEGLIDTLAWVDGNLTDLAAAPDTYQHKE